MAKPINGKFYPVLIVTLLLDQISKYVIRSWQPDIVLIPKILNITYITNTGASFGILKGMNGILLALSVAVIIGIAFYLKKNPEHISIPFALILAGALGNSIDRILFGAVTDFISISVSSFSWPAFNVADSAITVGVVLLLFSEWKEL